MQRSVPLSSVLGGEVPYSAAEQRQLRMAQNARVAMQSMPRKTTSIDPLRQSHSAIRRPSASLRKCCKGLSRAAVGSRRPSASLSICCKGLSRAAFGNRFHGGLGSDLDWRIGIGFGKDGKRKERTMTQKKTQEIVQ